MPSGINSNTIEYRLTAKDEASAVIQRAAKNVPDYVRRVAAAGNGDRYTASGASEGTLRRIARDTAARAAAADDPESRGLGDTLKDLNKESKMFKRLFKLGGAVAVA